MTTDPLTALTDTLNTLDAAHIDFDLAHGAVILYTPQGGQAGYILRGPGGTWTLRQRTPAEVP
jgi:hypothetical protein